MSREKITNIPTVVTALVAVMTLALLAQSFFPENFGGWALSRLSFIPARFAYLFAPDAVAQQLPDLDADDVEALFGAAQIAIISPLTYAFLHANWGHLAVNGFTLAAFGSPVARRLGTVRFLALFAVTAVAGALAHFAAHPFDVRPVVGASAAVSGMIAAIARFAFAFGQPLQSGASEAEEPRTERRRGERLRAVGLGAMLADRRAVAFICSWLFLNLLFGVIAPPPAGVGAIAWEAHLGGFLAGMALFGVFDRQSAPAR